MSIYNDVRKEVRDELLSTGIRIEFIDQTRTDSENVHVLARSLNRFTDKMVERALRKVDDHQHYAEIGRAAEHLVTLLTREGKKYEPRD